MQINGKHPEPESDHSFHSDFFPSDGIELLVERLRSSAVLPASGGDFKTSSGITSQSSGLWSWLWAGFPIFCSFVAVVLFHNANMSIPKWLSLTFLVLFFSCNKPLPTLDGIDKARWEEDKNGCRNVRASMREAIDAQKEELLALGQMQIVKLLGRPDQNELSSRNQKFFYYFIEPGPLCQSSSGADAERLAIRFNAMGLAKEVAIVRGSGERVSDQ